MILVISGWTYEILPSVGPLTFLRIFYIAFSALKPVRQDGRLPVVTSLTYVNSIQLINYLHKGRAFQSKSHMKTLPFRRQGVAGLLLS